jgi:hypothetical protein
MDTTDQGLISPPQIPMSLIMTQGESNRELILIYSEIINSEKTLYRNLLRLFHSCDYIEDTEYIEIPNELGKIEKIPTTKTKIIKLPSSDKTCPECHKIFKDECALFCDNPVHTEAEKPKLQYHTWSPIFDANGFNKIMTFILAGTDQIMSTGSLNVDGEDKEEKIPMKEMAIRATAANLSAITENIYEWSATGKMELTRGMYSSVANMICDHYFMTLSRSKGKENLLWMMGNANKMVIGNGGQGQNQRDQANSSRPGFWDTMLGRR